MSKEEKQPCEFDIVDQHISSTIDSLSSLDCFASNTSENQYTKSDTSTTKLSDATSFIGRLIADIPKKIKEGAIKAGNQSAKKPCPIFKVRERIKQLNETIHKKCQIAN